MRYSILFFLLTGFIACNQSQNTTEQSFEEADMPSPDEIRDSTYFERQKDLPRISAQYTRALTDYIDTIFTSVKPDTLFILSVSNDYDVQLPDKIHGVTIGYYPGENVVNEAIARRKTTVSLNIAGWPEELESEFIFVTFFDNARPQHNVHSWYSRSDTTRTFNRDSLRIEYQYDNTIPLSEYLGK